MADFWRQALGYQLQPPPEGFGSWDEFLDSIGIPKTERHDASAIGVDDGRRVVALRLRDADRVQELVPAAEALRRRLQLVAECLAPEVGHPGPGRHSRRRAGCWCPWDASSNALDDGRGGSVS